MEKAEDKSVLIEYFGDTPILRIIDFLLENRLFDYSKKQIIEETGLGKATFYKYWNRLLDVGVVCVTRAFGKARLYKLNESNHVVQRLIQLELSLIEETTPQIMVAKSTKKN